MRWTQCFIPTVREVAASVESKSQQLMLRAGMIHQSSSGIFTLLHLAVRSMQKIAAIIRKEMAEAGASELLMPTLLPTEPWQTTGRAKDYGATLFLLKDRNDRHYFLGPTHEEEVTAMMVKHLSSYKQLPLFVYQIQTKFRDELRPQGGLLRCREFLMKDAYSFHETAEDLNKLYRSMAETYHDIFVLCGLTDFNAGKAGSGEIGGDSIEFTSKSGIELGHIFSLGDKYSAALELKVQTAKGERVNVQMGCYGIGLGRIMVALLEESHDDKGIIWPKAVAPYTAEMIPIGSATWVYPIAQMFENQGIDVLIDDRDERPGVKFAEADAIGLPWRIVVSERLGLDKVEVKHRVTGEIVEMSPHHAMFCIQKGKLFAESES